MKRLWIPRHVSTIVGDENIQYIGLTEWHILGRRRALDRAMDEAARGPGKRRSRKQDGIVRNTGGPTYSARALTVTIGP